MSKEEGKVKWYLNPISVVLLLFFVLGWDLLVYHCFIEKGTNFIQKPFTVDGLARKVREVLDSGLNPPI